MILTRLTYTFLILFSVFNNLSYANSVFGSAFLLPIEASPSFTKLGLRPHVLHLLQKKNFNLVTQKVVNKNLHKFIKTLPRDQYNDVLMKQVFPNVKADLFFKIEIGTIKNSQDTLKIFIINNQGKVIFRRENIFSYTKASQLLSKLRSWVTEFQEFLPAMGRITSINNGKILIRIDHRNKDHIFDGKAFTITKLKYNDLETTTLKRMGAGIEEKNGMVQAYIYDEFKDSPFRIGDHVIFIDNQYNDNAKYKEKLLVSETWFNYINSPKFSLLDCALLPIVGNAQKETEIYDSVSKKIVEKKYCKYRRDEKLNDLLSKYSGNLNEHLNDTRVLKNLARILRVGALLRVGVYNILNGTSVSLEVVGENGEAIYFAKYAVIENPDVDYISDLVDGWVQEYRDSLPLAGKVVQVIDDRVIMDIPASIVDGLEQDFLIVRPISLKYEEVKGEKKISWKKKTLAKGLIDTHHENHSIGKIWEFVDKNTVIKEGDWVVINKIPLDQSSVLFRKHNIKNRRKAGAVRFIAELAQVSSTDGGSSESLINAGIGVEFYFPEGWLLVGEASRNVSGSDESISNNNFLVAGGYSMTPRLFEYISLVDFYAGYRIVNYGVEGLNIVGVGNLAYKGPFAGARVEIPFYKRFSVIAGANVYPFDSADNDEPRRLFGEAQSSKAFELNLISKYRLGKESQIFLDYKKSIYNTKYRNATEDISLKISSDLFRIGFSMDF